MVGKFRSRLFVLVPESELNLTSTFVNIRMQPLKTNAYIEYIELVRLQKLLGFGDLSSKILSKAA